MYLLSIVAMRDSSYPKKAPGREGFFIVEVQVVDCAPDSQTAKGEKAVITQCVTGDSEEKGKGKVKSMFVALLGATSDENLDEICPDWAEIWDACSGVPEAEGIHGKQPLTGRLVYCEVAQGNPVKNKQTKEAIPGQFYSNYFWAACDDQEATSL
jgi:hypothetical protein